MIKKKFYRFHIFHVLNSHLGALRVHYLIFALLSILSIIPMFAYPYFYELFIDDVFVLHKMDLLKTIISGYLILYIIECILKFFKVYFKNRITKSLILSLKQTLLKGYFKFSFQSTKDNQSVGEKKLRINDDVEKLSSFIDVQSIGFIVNLLTTIVSGIIIIKIEWRLSILAFVAIPITILFDDFMGNVEKGISTNRRNNDQHLSTWLNTSIANWREIRSFNLQKRQEIKFLEYLHKGALLFATWINIWVTRALIIPRVKDEVIMKFAVYFLGGYFIYKDYLSVGELLIFIVYYNYLNSSYLNVSRLNADLTSNKPYYDRVIQDLVDIKELCESKYQLENVKNIKIEELSFHYPNSDHNILNNFSLNIETGDRIVITGESGCGKSTFIQLIIGCLKPTSGNILYNGKRIEEISLDSIYSNICCIMQENSLFNTTIRENMMFQNPEATLDEIIDACEKVHIWDFINTLPQGLDTIVGDQGVKLSGGQRQKIILARGLLSKADLFILDESTSAIDPFSENIIKNTLDSLPKDTILIVISHSKTYLDICSKVVVLNE